MTKGKCFCVQTRRASRALSQLYDEALAPVQLRITQFSLLRNVERLEPVNVSRLSEEMMLDRSTLGRNLRPLQRRGLVRLVDGEDLREWSIELSLQGRNLLRRASPLWQAAQSKVERRLGKEGVAALEGLLEKFDLDG